ncbi:MAG: hypothetical protein ACRDKT_07260 [Actinomycetota bacterium]
MKVIVASRDLLAAGRLEAPARAAGADIEIVSPEAMVESLRADHHDLLVLDLDGGGRDLLAKVEEARAERVLPERVVGYFSHIDEEMAEAASLAAVHALPRGRFWRELPQLFSR